MHPWKLTWNPKMTRTCHNPKNWRDCGLPRVIHSQWNLPSNKWPILELDMKAWELGRVRIAIVCCHDMSPTFCFWASGADNGCLTLLDTRQRHGHTDHYNKMRSETKQKVSLDEVKPLTPSWSLCPAVLEPHPNLPHWTGSPQ